MPNSTSRRIKSNTVKEPKKLTAIQIGNINEKRTKEYYEKLGYVVETTRRAKFAGNDYFGLFDHLATSTRDFRLIQTKTNQMPTQKYREKIKALPVPPGVIKEIVLWKDGVDTPLIYQY